MVGVVLQRGELMAEKLGNVWYALQSVKIKYCFGLYSQKARLKW